MTDKNSKNENSISIVCHQNSGETMTIQIWISFLDKQENHLKSICFVKLNKNDDFDEIWNFYLFFVILKAFRSLTIEGQILNVKSRVKKNTDSNQIAKRTSSFIYFDVIRLVFFALFGRLSELSDLMNDWATVETLIGWQLSFDLEISSSNKYSRCTIR